MSFRLNKPALEKETNEFRRHFGLPDLKAKIRNCLRCDREFLSYSAKNRNCGCLYHLRNPMFTPEFNKD